MPRRQRELVVAEPRNSVVASATRYDGRTPRVFATDDSAWQTEAYRHYRICGEARFAAQFFGHALSKAVLYIAENPTDAKSPKATEGPAVEVLNELFNGSQGQEAMLAALGVHLTIAGECYLIGRQEKGAQVWEIRSVMEVKSSGVKGSKGVWWITPGGGQAKISLGANDTVIRIWTPDPQEAIRADSPFRSLLPILEEIEWLTRYVFAQCSSRLAGAGVFMVPEEIDFPDPPPAAQPNLPVVDLETQRTESNPGKADGLLALLADSMLKPITDPGNAAAKVPTVVTAPGDQIGNARWITFWSELDTEAKGLREEAIKRFALGMDLPPERVLGMSSNMGAGGGRSNGVSHWGAWQIDEDTIKMHVEPMLDVVVNALTTEYIRPTTENPTDTVRYDTATLRLRPDRSAEALELYDRGLIKGEIVVQENGFSVTEMMDEEERKLWLTVKVASGSATPEMVNEALSLLGVDLGPTGPALPAPGDMPNEARPAPSLEDHPNRDLPDPNYGLLAAADALCYRALERAGNRIKRVVRDGGGEPAACRSFEVHTYTPVPANATKKLLDDAWTCAADVLAPMNLDVDRTIATLNGYVTSLLITGNSHSRARLEKWLAEQS